MKNGHDRFFEIKKTHEQMKKRKERNGNFT